MGIAFRRLAVAELPLLYRWLREEHVRRWWGEPPADLDAKYRAYIDGSKPTAPYLIRLGGQPVGYIQGYRLRDYPDYQRQIGAGDDAAGIDLFLGEADQLGRGLGPRVIGCFLREIVFTDPAIAVCFIGPAVGNQRAIRAYEKAGFVYERTVAVPDEPEPEYIMTLARPPLPR